MQLQFRLLLITGLSALSLIAEPMRPGIGIVSSYRKGVALTNDSGVKQKLNLHDTFNASGLRIQTDKNGKLIVVLANGVSLGFSDQTEASILTFEQEPFDSSKEGFEYEPSTSNLEILLKKGSIGISCDHLSPLSNFIVRTPVGDLKIFSSTCVLTLDDYGVRVSAYDGTSTFYYKNNKSREFIAVPQSVRISEQSAKLKVIASEKTIDLVETESQRLADSVLYARKRILFRFDAEDTNPVPIIVLNKSFYDQESVIDYSYKEKPIE